MNVENILKVANAIEQHSIPDLGFNMSCRCPEKASKSDPDLSFHNCGTVVCVAGWADAIFISEGGAHAAFENLDADTYERLIMPIGWSDNRYTSAQAVRTLRHLAATGEVNWNHPDPA